MALGDRSPVESMSDGTNRERQRNENIRKKELIRVPTTSLERRSGESSSIKDPDDNDVTTLTLASISVSASGVEECESRLEGVNRRNLKFINLNTH
jgi:hypothetical protein